MGEESYAVYLLSNRRNGTLYIGVTGHLARRVSDHQAGAVSGFTRKHGLKRLVYVEFYPTALEAITREKQLKRWRRRWKLELIESKNPYWRDLTEYL